MSSPTECNDQPRATEHRLFLLIDGQRISGGGRRERPVINPATGKLIGHLPLATVVDVDRAAEAATRGFQQWCAESALHRARVMADAATRIRAEADLIARLLTLEQGKTLREATAEVLGAADLFEWLGEQGKRVYGRIVAPRAPGVEQLVMHEAVGPVAAFSPWNYPVALAARKIAQALAAGCSIIIKPAEEAPSAVLALAQVCHEAGVPPAALQVLYGVPAEVSARLIASPHIRKISFTGSIPVGKHLGALAGGILKKVTFELGGHAPVIVMDNANLDSVVDLGVAAKYRNAGQICISPTRFFVHDAVYDELIARFASRASALRVGDGMLRDTDMGPLAHERRVSAMVDLTEDALNRGARLVSGGAKPANIKAGFFFEPTVIGEVPADARVMTEEPFGPLALFARFSDLDGALARANLVEHGLAGYAFTRSVNAARRIQSGLRVGLVGINTFAVTTPEMPFAGVKNSGLGCAMGTEGLLDHMNIKSVFRADS